MARNNELILCVYNIIPDGLKQDDSGEMISDEGKEKWGLWVSYLHFPANGDRRAGEQVVLFGTHRILGPLLSFTTGGESET